MASKNNGTIAIVFGGIGVLFVISKFPVFLKELPKLPEPEATGHVVGTLIPAIVALIFIIYGIVLFKRSRQPDDNNKAESNKNL